MTNIRSIIQVIGCEDIDKLLSLETVVRNVKKPPDGGKSSFLINSVDYCESIHDIPENYSEKDILEFIAQYKRRYNRIIDLIKSDSHAVFFLHHSRILENNKNDFIECVKKINPNCIFSLIELTTNKDEDRKFIRENNNILTINLDKYKLREKIVGDWRNIHLDWRNIFITILKN